MGAAARARRPPTPTSQLGRINKDYFCGGEVIADMAALDAALVGRSAASSGMTNTEVARGIVRIANSNMVNALKLVSVNRGYDPRDFTLVVFGGGGPMHGVALGKELGRQEGRGPARRAGVLGLGHADVRPQARLLRHRADGRRQRRRARRAASIAPASAPSPTSRARRCRPTRSRCIAVHPRPLPEPGVRGRGAASRASGRTPRRWQQLIADFHDAYEREYTYRLDAGVEIIGLHLIASSEVGKLEIVALPRTGATIEAAIKGRRAVDYATEGVHEATIYDGDELEPGMAFAGPAVIEDAGTTVVVHPGQHASRSTTSATSTSTSRG